jgi:RDD family
MAKYEPFQPFWKRASAGVLDAVLAVYVLGTPIAKLIGSRPASTPSSTGTTASLSFNTPFWTIEGWPALVLLALVVAYFVVLSRTGGTVFQRVFGMKRAIEGKQNTPRSGAQ